MARTTLPLFPTDDGWPYPDGVDEVAMIDDTEPDLDALELQADRHAFDGLTLGERAAVVQHFGLDGKTPVPSKRLADTLGCSRAEAREMLGSGIDKLRTRLSSTDLIVALSGRRARRYRARDASLRRIDGARRARGGRVHRRTPAPRSRPPRPRVRAR